ncbi:hypothetical protein PH586_21430, partial [Pseudomonas sp. SA3-5]
MSSDSWDDNCLTPLERAAGVGRLLTGGSQCHCGQWECDLDHAHESDERKKKIENSEKFKAAAKLVAGLNSNREIKLALINKVYHDSLQSAVVRYMSKEKLPGYYAAILKSSECIDRLLEGVLYKVCKIEPDNILADQIGNLSNALRKNAGRLTAYDRVTNVQQFIHCTVDQRFGVGASRSIPVVPMKNALCAARLHFNISDVTDRQPSYTEYIDTVSNASIQIEYDDPRPSTALSGKRSWPRWRVRHLRPISYYFPQDHRTTIQALK